MAYGVKYRFQLESYNKTVYRVDVLEDGYSGSIMTRPLGKAPVIRLQESDPLRSSSCDLVLECQTDGEYVDLYTTDPFQYKVEVYWLNGNSVTSIWRGYVATEIYSEPDIAPPYDVKITATDGLGILKEYTFEADGVKLIRTHICDLLEKAGDPSPMFYYATSLRKYGGTVTNFLDDANIDLDYMAGKSCYDVLKTILESLRTILCQWAHTGCWSANPTPRLTRPECYPSCSASAEILRSPRQARPLRWVNPSGRWASLTYGPSVS